MIRKICLVTGSRSEFGLLRWLMKAINESSKLSLQVVATGMHLSPEYGLTYREIETSGFVIDEKVEMLINSDTAYSVTKSIGLGIIGFADVYRRLKPDLLLVLGDRFETFSAASAAMICGLPIAHLHGGETTEGVVDESMRHSITKFSHLHFVACKEYRNRVIQLGESPERIFNVGGLGVDAISKFTLMSRQDLELSLGLKLLDKSLLVTFHPLTIEGEDETILQTNAMLNALEDLRDTTIIFTMPNADSGGKAIKNLITNFVYKNTNAKAFTSLGQLLYFSCLANVDGVVGNSSSGLLEAPSFKIGSVNIGDRQKGRLCPQSVINCEPEKHAILTSIRKLYSRDFQAKVAKVKNPFARANTSEVIVSILENFPLAGILKKQFYDLPNCEIKK